MPTIACSSETYLIKTSELKVLPVLEEISPGKAYGGEIVLFLDAEKGDALISGAAMVKASVEPFLSVRLAYKTPPLYLGFFLNLIKRVKRRHYIYSPSVYTTTLECIKQNKIERGERNAENAYQWTNKRYQLSSEEKKQRYEQLYQSIKEHGFDRNSPVLILLNRKFGVRDQVYQGHHRIGVCKELGIKEIAVSFCAVPKSFDFLKWFLPRKYR